MSKLTSPFPKETYERNAEIYKLMANPKRLEILNILKMHEATLTQLVETVKAPKPNISQHLAILSHLRLIKRTRRDREAYYKIVDPKIVAPCRIMKEIWEKK